ncbi:hypothetical protein OsI_19480 [Oryza sativa Indica Group]|uniref:Uncharacterized protein n=1 Tax=Oryza sativa subsp. indica TaxID=39946 RepID=A2Y391_ORYSI|nr:hypothetical protein OsI_19480 [Oryza sativa Indica Group]
MAEPVGERAMPPPTPASQQGASTDWKQVSSGTGLYKVSDGLLSNPTPISWSSLAVSFPSISVYHGKTLPS